MKKIKIPKFTWSEPDEKETVLGYFKGELKAFILKRKDVFVLHYIGEPYLLQGEFVSKDIAKKVCDWNMRFYICSLLEITNDE